MTVLITDKDTAKRSMDAFIADFREIDRKHAEFEKRRVAAIKQNRAEIAELIAVAAELGAYYVLTEKTKPVRLCRKCGIEGHDARTCKGGPPAQAP